MDSEADDKHFHFLKQISLKEFQQMISSPQFLLKELESLSKCRTVAPLVKIKTLLRQVSVYFRRSRN